LITFLILDYFQQEDTTSYSLLDKIVAFIQWKESEISESPDVSRKLQKCLDLLEYLLKNQKSLPQNKSLKLQLDTLTSASRSIKLKVTYN
jgi:hypothetical protein